MAGFAERAGYRIAFLRFLLMAFPNIMGLYFLGGVVKSELSEYEEKIRDGSLEVYK